jgi:hypothetical protein
MHDDPPPAGHADRDHGAYLVVRVDEMGQRHRPTAPRAGKPRAVGHRAVGQTGPGYCSALYWDARR